MTSRCRLFPLFLLPVVAFACGDPVGPDGPPEPIQLPRSLSGTEQQVIGASNAFALDLLRTVHAGETESPNVFLSPLSVSMALGMTMNGAAGDTWTQMRDMLGFGALDEAAINQAYRDLIDLLLGLDPQVTFGLGNSVWAASGIPFHQAFYDRVATYFDAEARELDFGDPGARDVINGWVSDVTNGRIPEILDRIPIGTIMYLINAIYFEGDWRQQFDPDRTASQPFLLADGGSVTVPLMAVEGTYRTFVTETARGIELPYGGDAFTAVAVLPTGDRGIGEVVAGLDAATWAAWVEQLDGAAEHGGAEAVVELPRFELAYDRTLNDDLKALGMVDAFSGAADLSRLTSAVDAYVSQVIHKTFLRVDEEGTEAAAATAVEIRETAGPPTWRFDRPFLLAIRERLSGTILFMGVIGDPS